MFDRYLSIILSAALSLGAGSALAVEAPEPIQDLVITGERVPHEAISQSTVIEVEELRQRNSASTLELLRHTPGLDVFQRGGPGGTAEVQIRGAEAKHTVVTVDGVRVSDTTDPKGGGFDFGLINPDDIERIEVLRGSLSSLYGSEALAGAINIVTRRPEPGMAATARVEAGSYESRRAHVSLEGGALDGVRGRLSLAHLDSGEPVPGSSAQVDSVRGALDWSPTEQRTLDLRLSYAQRDRTSYPMASGGSRYAVNPQLEEASAEEFSAQLGWRERLDERTSLTVRLATFEREEDVDTPGIPDGVLPGRPGMVSNARISRHRLTADGNWQPLDNLEVAGGGEYQRESGEVDAVLDMGVPIPAAFDLERDNLGAFVEGRYRGAQGVELFVSARVDRPESHSTESSAKVSLAYDFAERDTRIGASWGNGFKLPTFYALGDPLVGNPELEPESSHTTEVYIRQRLLDQRLYWNLAAFRTRYDDLLDFDFATFRMVNREQLAVDGVELDFTGQWSDRFSGGGHLTLLDYSGEAGQPVERAKRRGGLFGQWQHERWQARLQWLYMGSRPSMSVPTGEVALSSFQRWDLALQRELSSRVNLSVNLDNLTDTDYQEEAGFPSPGRILRLGLGVRL